MTPILAVLIFLATPLGPRFEAADLHSTDFSHIPALHEVTSIGGLPESPLPNPARHDRENEEETQVEAELESDFDLTSETLPSAQSLLRAHRARDGSHAYIQSGQTCGMKLRMVALLRC